LGNGWEEQIEKNGNSYREQGDHLYGKPGNARILTAVSEMSGILLKVRKVSGKKSCQGKVA